MREYKFRIYSFVSKSFIYFDVYNYPQGIAGGVSEPQQYTGLKDKNNNPIYEGDVVARHHVDLVHKVEYLSNDYYKVEYCEKQAAYICRDCDGNYLRLWTFNYEAVGNIYEWPCVKKYKNFDHNGECLTCDAWATDCPFFKLSGTKTPAV